jgi:hypothetical protein
MTQEKSELRKCQLCSHEEKLYILADNTPAKLEICLTCRNTILATHPDTELLDALEEWTKSLDLLMKLNSCTLADLIGDYGNDLSNIYWAYQKVQQ